ncbi:MAG: hypothetical protein J6J11_00240 [Treponema sp.]|nr:hypothetical protein [Treponema sp.]
MMEFLDLFLHIILVVVFYIAIFGISVFVFFVFKFLAEEFFYDFPILSILLILFLLCFIVALVAYYPFFDSLKCFYDTYIFPEYLQEKYFPPIEYSWI